MPLPYLAGRVNYVAVENHPYSLRQQDLPKALRVKSVPSKLGMTTPQQSIRYLVGRCQMIMDCFEGFRSKTMGLSFEADKIRFEYCVNYLGHPQYFRAIQGHVGGEELDEQLQSHETFSVSSWIFLRLRVLSQE